MNSSAFCAHETREFSLVLMLLVAGCQCLHLGSTFPLAAVVTVRVINLNAHQSVWHCIKSSVHMKGVFSFSLSFSRNMQPLFAELENQAQIPPLDFQVPIPSFQEGGEQELGPFMAGVELCLP